MLLEEIEAQILRHTTFPLHLRSVGNRGLVVLVQCAWPIALHVYRPRRTWLMADGRVTFRLAPEVRRHSDVVAYLEQHQVDDDDGEMVRRIEDCPGCAFLAFADLLSAIIFTLRLHAYERHGRGDAQS